MLKNLLLLPAAALVALGVAACGDNDDDPQATNTPPTGVATNTPESSSDQVQVDLEPVGADGVAGVAVLAESADGMNTSVTVTLNDAAATGTAAIHSGTCSNWGDTAVATIGSVQAGYAAGAVSLSLNDIESDDHVVVVLPETGGEPISCGQV
jgi:hypothetical protein